MATRAANTRLREAMRRCDVSAATMCAELGISISAAQSYLAGRMRVRRVLALAVQATWGIRATWILHGTGAEFVESAAGPGAGAHSFATSYSRLPRQLRKQLRTVLNGLHRTK